VSAQLSFLSRLREVLIPTLSQVLGCYFLSLILLASAQSHALIQRLGVTQAGLVVAGNQFDVSFNTILRSPITGQAALVAFWAITGLVAYLVCWGAYNLIIEARNEVTLSTTYTNQGARSGLVEVLAVKAVSSCGLALVLLTMGPGISIWFALSADAVTQSSIGSIGHALIAVVCFALQLYATLAFVQLTFTPWYRPEAFTGE
jgi:hypothetical protein